jgi:TolB-like protein/Tfp pilus assembly protein PilF
VAIRRPAQKIESIAVLPLENLSADPAHDYFADGMTDELIGELARIGSLRVISRTSVVQYKGTRKSLPAIAKELNVVAIVEGTVVQSGGRVRITAQLIRADDDRHLWSAKYERDVAEVLPLQAEVARAIAREIQIKLTADQQTHLKGSHRVKPEAFEAYLRGNSYLYKGIPGLKTSIEFFTRAIQLDPNLPEAYAGLGEALVYAGIFELRPSNETYPQAKEAALNALRLDDSNAAAHNILADVKKGYDWDLEGALTEYRRALELNPSHLLTRLWYSECLSRMGRHDDALQESKRAVALDPVSSLSHNNRAMLLWRARQYDEAIRESEHALMLDPNLLNAYWWQSQAWTNKGDFEKAIACLKIAVSANDGPLFRALLGYVYGRAGQQEKTRGILKDLRLLAKQQFVSPVEFALVYTALGDRDSAFEWLEKAFAARTTRIHELSFPYYDSLRPDPRFPGLMKRIGLPL